MNNNLNLVEILKDCPIGTKFYSSYLGKNVIFIEIYDNHIKCEYSSQIDSLNCSIQFRKDGSLYPGGDCMLFPSKEQRDWSKWQNPFVDGDILANDYGRWIGIVRKIVAHNEYEVYVAINADGYIGYNNSFFFNRPATEKEKQKLFNVIKKNGYEWDSEKKELKTLQPFKDGDILLNKPDSECMLLLTKNQYDWSIRQRPFVDGDVVMWGEDEFAIFKEYIKHPENDDLIRYHVYYNAINNDLNTDSGQCCMQRLATEEEKRELFDAIKSHGYKWNADEKKLEKLIEPKFKVGDSVRSKTDNNDEFTITSIYNNKHYYGCGKGHEFMIPIEKQDNWELVSDEIKPKFKVGDTIRHKSTGNVYTILFVLSNGYGGGVYDVSITNEIGKSIDVKEQDDYELVPNKFDISTLIPYESKVLIRNTIGGHWQPAFWGAYTIDHSDGLLQHHDYLTTKGFTHYCIPYDGNEHLIGKTDDCCDFYKTWEE